MRNDYLSKTAVPKLHIGGGWRRLDGWLNTDLDLIPDVMRMDATQRFPFNDRTFQYVYTEHMIEHVSHPKGVDMLRECHRVMREGGVIRVVTPNLAAILGTVQQRPVAPINKITFCGFVRRLFRQECSAECCVRDQCNVSPVGAPVYLRRETLADTMRAAGFTSSTRWLLGDSDHARFAKLGNEQRYPEGLLTFESLTLEGISKRGRPFRLIIESCRLSDMIDCIYIAACRVIPD